MRGAVRFFDNVVNSRKHSLCFVFFFWKIPASITIRVYVLKALVTALTVIKRFIKTVTETYAKVLCADAKLAASSRHILTQTLLQLTGV